LGLEYSLSPPLGPGRQLSFGTTEKLTQHPGNIRAVIQYRADSLGIRFHFLTGVIPVIDRHALKARIETVDHHFKSYDALPTKLYELNITVQE
jgi:hypothetical protein